MSWDKHPAVRTGDALPLKERAAESVSSSIGSWSFLFWQTLIVGIWIIINTIVVVKHFDPYPFILLNLAFSTQAAYATPIILLAQKRQDARNAEVANSDHRMLMAICEHLGVPTVEIPEGVPAGGPGEDPQGEPQRNIGVYDFIALDAAVQRTREMYYWNAREHSNDCPRHCICWGPANE